MLWVFGFCGEDGGETVSEASLLAEACACERVGHHVHVHVMFMFMFMSRHVHVFMVMFTAVMRHVHDHVHAMTHVPVWLVARLVRGRYRIVHFFERSSCYVLPGVCERLLGAVPGATRI